MEKIEHLGIAVKDLNKANILFEKLLGVPHYKIEEVASEGVKTSFFQSIAIYILESIQLDIFQFVCRDI